jgi:hypothetical protein
VSHIRADLASDGVHNDELHRCQGRAGDAPPHLLLVPLVFPNALAVNRVWDGDDQNPVKIHMSITCDPALQSWCIQPANDRSTKFTPAHEYLQRNPAVMTAILRNSRFTPAPVFSVVLSPDAELTPDFVLDTLQKWDLTDVLDLTADLKLTFRTPVSAHVCCKLQEFKATPLTPIPPTARVPLVYVQGMGPDARPDEIRAFFKTISPILTLKSVERGDIFLHLLRFSSIRKALKVSETADRERFKGNLLTVSHQYKLTVTQFFFLSGPAPGALTCDAVGSEVAQIGEIDRIFVNEAGPMKEVFVSMNDVKSAKLACGAMNHRIYNGEVVNAFFVDGSYFQAVWEANQGR